MSDPQIDDLNLEVEEDEDPDGSPEPKSSKTVPARDLFAERRRRKAAEAELAELRIQAFRSEFPQFEPDELHGQDLGKLRTLLSKLKPSEEPAEPVSDENEDQKRFLATRAPSQEVKETYTAREIHEMRQRGDITDTQMRDLIATRMK